MLALLYRIHPRKVALENCVFSVMIPSTCRDIILKVEKLPKDATKKSFKRRAVLSADQFPPLTLGHPQLHRDDKVPIVNPKDVRLDAVAVKEC